MGKRRKFFIVILLTALVTTLGTVQLTSIPNLVAIRQLEARSPIRTGISSACHRSDVIEPFEYRLYCWRQAFSQSCPEIERALRAEGAAGLVRSRP